MSAWSDLSQAAAVKLRMFGVTGSVGEAYDSLVEEEGWQVATSVAAITLAASAQDAARIFAAEPEDRAAITSELLGSEAQLAAAIRASLDETRPAMREILEERGHLTREEASAFIQGPHREAEGLARVVWMTFVED